MPPRCLLWLFALFGVGAGLVRPPSEALNASIIEFRDASSFGREDDREASESRRLDILPELQQPHPPSIPPRVIGERDVDPGGPPAPPIIVSFDEPEGRSVRADNETVSLVLKQFPHADIVERIKADLEDSEEHSDTAPEEEGDDQGDSLPSSNPTSVVGPPAVMVNEPRIALRDVSPVSTPAPRSDNSTVTELETTTSATAGTTLAEPPSPTVSNSAPLCNSATELPTFIRHANSVFSAVVKSASQKNTGSPNANFIIKMSTLQECGDVCRRQNFDGMEAADGGPFQCHGFSFTSVRKRGIAVNSPAEDCAESAFSFELYPGQLLSPVPGEEGILEQIVVEERKRCLDFCLSNLACKSVNYHTENGTCQAMGSTWRMLPHGLVDSDQFDHYENTCFQERNRCSTSSASPSTGIQRTRIDFLLTRKHEFDEATFDMVSLPASVMSVRSCMRACVESEPLICRSFQYSNDTDQCTITTESFEHYTENAPPASSLSVVPSESFDLYEPICLDEGIDEGACPKDYVFERVPKVDVQDLPPLKQAASIKVHTNLSLEDCMDACLREPACLSFSYSAKEVPLTGQSMECRLRSVNRASSGVGFKSDDRVDYYELACQRTLLSPTTVSTAPTTEQTSVSTASPSHQASPTSTNATAEKSGECGRKSILIERQRTLRLDYRSVHHINVKGNEECEHLCEQATIQCMTFAYNSRSRDCLLSTTSIDRNSRFALLTQPNPNYELYTFLGGRPICENSTRKEESEASPIPSNASSNPASSVPTTQPPAIAGNESGPTEKKVSTKSGNEPRSTSVLRDATSPATPTQPPKASSSSPPTSTEGSVGGGILVDSDLLGSPSNQHPSVPLESATIHSMVSPVLPHRHHEVRRLEQDSVRAEAVCLPKGVNVTFKIVGERYTGAVYAAERYAQCVVEVDGRDDFSIFIQRPSVNGACNALEEEDGKFSVVLVMSNDMVVPLDVTTKEDLFFEVECDYGSGRNSLSGNFAKPGLVLNGQKSHFTRAEGVKSQNDRRTKVSLKFLRKGKPVRDVYTGERLTAVIDTKLDANRLAVLDCNATRVTGGRHAKPVLLVDRGCTLRPQIIGNIVHAASGRLEAPFRVFQVGGTGEVDIVCNVVVCRKRCDWKRKTTKCPHSVSKRSATGERQLPSLDDLNNDGVLNEEGRDTDGETFTIDQRLRVMPDEDESAVDNKDTLEFDRRPTLHSNQRAKEDKNKDKGDEGLFKSILRDVGMAETSESGDYCLSPIILFIAMSLILLTLLVASISLMARWCRRKPPSLANSIYPTSAELGSHFHIPRIERFMA